MEFNALKSSFGRNALYYLNEITKNVDRLNKKLKESNKTNIDCSDLLFFKELCASGEPKVSGIACEAVVNFITSGTFSLTDAFTWFIPILQSSSEKNKNSIVQVITNLLLLNEETRLKLHPSQHPFILAIKQDERNWSAIVFNLNYIFKNKSDIDSQRLFFALTPLFKYLLWSPVGATSSMCKRGAWKFFIDNICSRNVDFLVQTLCWLPGQNSYSILDIDHFLSDYGEFYRIMNDENLNDTVCVYYAYVSCKLAEHGHNPTSALQVTKTLLQKYPATTDVVLVLIAQTLIDCPAQFLNILLLTCVELIERNENENGAIQWLVLSAVLPWLIHSLPLIANVHETAEKLFAMVDGNKQHREERNLFHLLSNKYFMQVVTSEKEMHWAFVIASSLETLNHKHLLEHICDVQIAVEETRKHPLLRLCVNAILLSSNDVYTQMKAMDVALAINPAFQLPIILYMLARAPHPKLQLKLLHSLPRTATEKENVSAILRSTDSLFSSGKKILKDLSVEMYFILWKVEERCYSCLHDRLLEYKTSFPLSDRTWETDVVLASTIRHICESKPEKHGKEWISILNEIIKRWHQKKEGTAASVLALDAILILCKAEVLEIISIYKLLSERLFDDKQVDIIKKFCALTEHMFVVTSKEPFDELETILLHATSKMWSIISSSTEKESISSAMNALSKFNKNEMPLRVVPEVYWRDIKLPKLPEESQALPSFVPGDVWIGFLQNVREDVRDEACEMLTFWLQEEVDNFPRSLYGSIRGEPKDFNFLHHRCLCKSLVNHLKMFARQNHSHDKSDIETSITCLKILNGDLPKTLPLLNWSFLWQLLEIKEFRLTEQVIILFAKQSKTSSSARICIENYLKDFHILDQKDELRIVLNAMTDICCGVSTVILKCFLDSVVNLVITKMIDRDKCLLLVVYDNFRKALQNPDIEDNNRICISECIGIFWENTSHDDEVFIYLNNVATELPITYIEHLCSLSVVQDFTLDKVRKLLRLRCAMALKDNNDDPFVWLQECVEVTTLYLKEQSLYYQYTLEVILKYRSHSSRWHWLLKYMSYIHSVLNESSEAKLNFFCDVFIFNVVSLSIYKLFVPTNSFSEECFRFFPQALNDIMTEEVSSQVIEWLYYMNKSVKINQNYRLLFYNGMLSLKNSKYLLNINNWSKMLL